MGGVEQPDLGRGPAVRVGRGRGAGCPHQRAAPYLVGEDLQQDLVLPKPVPYKQLVLCTQSHILADSYHSVLSENRVYLPTEEADQACFL